VRCHDFHQNRDQLVSGPNRRIVEFAKDGTKRGIGEPPHGPRRGWRRKRAVASCTRLLGSFWKPCCKPSSGAVLVQSLVDRSFLQRPVVLEFPGDL